MFSDLVGGESFPFSPFQEEPGWDWYQTEQEKGILSNSLNCVYRKFVNCIIYLCLQIFEDYFKQEPDTSNSQAELRREENAKWFLLLFLNANFDVLPMLLSQGAETFHKSSNEYTTRKYQSEKMTKMQTSGTYAK